MLTFTSPREPYNITAAPAYANDMDDFSHQHHFNNSPLLGSGDDESTWRFHRDPEAESVRSHPSSHHTADQSLLPSSAAAATPPSIPTTRPQPQRLQRRRNHYHYINGVLVPTSPADIRQNQQQQQQVSIAREEENIGSMIPSRFHPHSHHSSHRDTAPQQHKRAKSYSMPGGGSSGGGGGASSWLLGGASALVGSSESSSKRSSWTGERREIRKLQKEHPVGSARPSFSLEIGEGDENENENSGLRRSSSVLGVKRRMERLRGLYRKGDKEIVSGLSNRR